MATTKARGPAHTDDTYAKECVTIEPVAIQEEYIRVPADLYYWNGQYTEALQGHLEAKAERERIEEMLRLEMRRGAESGSIPGLTGKVTVGEIDALIITDPRYQEAVRAEIQAEVAKSRVSGVVEAVHAKRELIVSLGAHLRQEREPSLRDKDHHSRR